MTTRLSKHSLLTLLLSKGECVIGEILITNKYSLRHRDDRLLLEKELTHYSTPQAARHLARYDDQGGFRPLKTAPNLRRGWLLQLENEAQVLLALDFFYPAALDLYGALQQQTLSTTPLRETLHRQTGMYRIAHSINDEEAQELIAHTCCSHHGCLRKILWSIAPGQEIETLPPEKKTPSTEDGTVPLLCREACNLLVAAARTVVKKRGQSHNLLQKVPVH